MQITVEDALKQLVGMDSQIVCPRPTVFGEIAHLIADLAAEAEDVSHKPELFGNWVGIELPKEGRRRKPTMTKTTSDLLSKAHERIHELEVKIERSEEFRKMYRCLPEEFHKGMLDNLVSIAYRAGEISTMRACELLEERVDDFNEREWVQGPGLDDLLADDK